MNDDKFGVCGLIWIGCMLLLISAFKEWGIPILLTIILSITIALVIAVWIYNKWTK